MTGGTDNEWANEIERKVNIISRATNIRIEVFNINQELVKNLFWNGVETLLATLYEEEYAKKQLQRLYLYKQAQGWFVLNKGSTAVVVGPRETFLRVVDEIYEWKENISHITFEIAFKMYHEKIFSYIGTKVPPPLPPLPPLPEPPIVSITWKTINGCLIAEIPIDHVPTTADGKFSKRIVSCLTCHQSMEMIGVTYKCCHTTKPY